MPEGVNIAIAEDSVHSVSDDMSFEQYKQVIELVHKYGSY